MNLYLQRHCKPTPGHPMDGSRSLTPEGVKQAQGMAAWMVKHIGRVDYVVTSPFNRAMETAGIMGKELGAAVIATSAALEPNGKPEDMWAEIQRLAMDSKDVLVVGHDPSIQSLLWWLLASEESDSANELVRFEHGAIAWLKVSNDDGALQWLVTPDLVIDPEEAEVLEAARELALALAEYTLREGWVTMDGRPVFIGGEDSSKADTARASYKPVDEAKQQRIADESEKELAAELGLDRTPDNNAFDLKTGRIAVEVKTLVTTKNDKITMSKTARLKKLDEAKREKLRTYTVVVDKRTATPKYYFSGGVGSFRISAMQTAKSMADLKSHIK